MTGNIIGSATRRDVLQALAGLAAATAATAAASPAVAESKVATSASKSAGGFTERTVMRDGHKIYVRDYPGADPAYVMVHGFPDNSRIYELIAPMLSAAGHRVVAFDFLGFGASDKPKGYAYSFAQQIEDMNAVINDLKLGEVIPVGHDAGGPAAVNYALDNKDRVASLVLLNCYYADSPARSFPDFIELCCNPRTKLLAHAMMTDPKQAGYLFNFQQGLLMANMTPEIRKKFVDEMQPIIAHNFTQKESAMPAFLAMTGNAYENLAANTARVPELAEFKKPVKLIWGAWDKYLSVATAKDIALHFPNAHFTGLEAEHWPQWDRPDDVVKAMLS
ncbi:alpha/beta hydrolase [Rhizobium sp. S152]|uniref:alpha/beta fold hydrolase n=1 Tax=Rhizobium sp. S152 TaxID=3055038 RepID=UPI0025A96D94|nr:alpha/beta hydrolase [Rhizobium sp. S152]MDM9628536.1 alpha/beta hydrolase [Rhizobium sp. S152]